MALAGADVDTAGCPPWPGAGTRPRGPLGGPARWCALITAVGSVLIACGSQPVPRPAQAPPSTPAGAAPVAYTSAGGLGIAAGTTVTAHAPGDFRYASARFSADGRFVFATAGTGKGMPAGDERLAYIDAHTGRTRALPLTGRPVPAAGSTVVWWEGPDRLLEMDLGAPAPEPRLRQTVRLPAPEPPGAPEAVAGVQVLGAGRSATLLARVECPCGSGGENPHLYLLGPDGAVRSLGEPAMGSTVSAGADADGTMVAFAINGRSGATCGVSTVVRVDLADGSVTKSWVRREDGCSTITHLWWGGGGALFAGYTGHDAFGGAPGVPGVWEQTAQGWRQSDAGPALQRLHLSPDVDAVLAPAAGPAGLGTLYLEAAGRRTAVAAQVASIAAPPPPAG